MEIFDMHIHAWDTEPDPDDILCKMEKAGVYGGCIFSNMPDCYDLSRGTSFEKRLDEIIEWTDGYKGRLFPVLWIHPYEKKVMKKIYKAIDAGVSAFKIICNNFYVYEPKVLKLLSAIAETGKPVFFHTGILWDGAVSSSYNRPINFESLIHIKNLRFSLGHCSWPWHDECIALYGKFLNGLLYNEDSSEMFFDITPGTPPVYRKDLLTKLFTIGYDVPHNILFGTDSSADDYNKDNWVVNWIKRDNEIYEYLNLKEEILNKLYHDNLLRFLGLVEKDFTHRSPSPDSAEFWEV